MQYPISDLNKVNRGAKKASYDKEVIHAILDETEICHVAFNFEGKAFVQPINFGRKSDKIYLHGSHQNRMTQAIIDAKEVCVNVMILDAMKLTRSAFHHSVNYRSVMIFGEVRELETNEEKLVGLEAIINHFVPNRWKHCRKPNDDELKATRVLEITIRTASAKIATAPPNDNKSDRDLPFWAGTIPVKTVLGKPFPDKHMAANAEIPQHVLELVSASHLDGKKCLSEHDETLKIDFEN